MNISVVVVAYNEEQNITSCLNALTSQDYSTGAFEIIVVDGDSNDRTQELVRRHPAGRAARLRLSRNQLRRIAPGRNEGIRNSSYDFIAFTDADCVVPQDWLSKLAFSYAHIVVPDNRTAAVGGANRPPRDGGPFYRALGICLDSWLGSFNSPQGRDFKILHSVKSLSCSNVLYRKEAILESGGFDESLGNVSEDCDLNVRLIRQGYHLYFVPGVAVEHKLRPSMHAWAKNMFLYGTGRAQVTFKHGQFGSVFFMYPMLFICVIFLAPFFCPSWFFSPPVFYLFLLFFYSLGLSAMKRELALTAHVLAVFLVTHLSYALGIAVESFKIALFFISVGQRRPVRLS